MPIDMKKYQGVTAEDVLAEIERRKGSQTMNLQGMDTGISPGERITNSFRTQAGLGPLAQTKGGGLGDILTALKIKQLVSPQEQQVPEGFTLAGGKVVRDPTYKRQDTPDERIQSFQDEIDKKELSEQAKLLPKLDMAEQAVSQLEAQFGRAVPEPTSVQKGDVFGGLKARAEGLTQRASGLVGANADVRTYENLRKSFASLISKGGFMEAGVLTNQDIQRALAAIPLPGSTKEEVESGFREIKTILGSARQRYDSSRSRVFGDIEQVEQTPSVDPLEARKSALRARYGNRPQ